MADPVAAIIAHMDEHRVSAKRAAEALGYTPEQGRAARKARNSRARTREDQPARGGNLEVLPTPDEPQLTEPDPAAGDLEFWTDEVQLLHQARMAFLGSPTGTTAFGSTTKLLHAARIELRKAIEAEPDDGSEDEAIAELASDIREFTPEQRRLLLRLVEAS